MLTRKGLLGLAAGFALTGTAAAIPETPADLPIQERGVTPIGARPHQLELSGKPAGTANPVAWAVIAAGVWELLLEHLTFPLGTAVLRESDENVSW